MKKWLTRLGVALAALLVAGAAAVLVVPGWRITTEGWFAGEPTARGRPVRYWRWALLEEKPAAGTEVHTSLWYSQPSVIDAFRGTPETATAPVLLGLLGDGDYYVRARAVEALGRLHSPDPQVRAALTGALRDADRRVRWTAVVSLAVLGADAHEAAPALQAALHDDSEVVRWEAAIALGKVGPTPGTVETLTAALADASPFVRWRAAEALGQLGANAREAMPAMRQALEKAAKGDDAYAELERDTLAAALKAIAAPAPAAGPSE